MQCEVAPQNDRLFSTVADGLAEICQTQAHVFVVERNLTAVNVGSAVKSMHKLNCSSKLNDLRQEVLAYSAGRARACVE